MNNNQQAVLAAFIVMYGEEWEWKKQCVAVSNMPLVLWNLVCVCLFAGHNLVSRVHFATHPVLNESEGH